MSVNIFFIVMIYRDVFFFFFPLGSLFEALQGNVYIVVNTPPLSLLPPSTIPLSLPRSFHSPSLPPPHTQNGIFLPRPSIASPPGLGLASSIFHTADALSLARTHERTNTRARAHTHARMHSSSLTTRTRTPNPACSEPLPLPPPLLLSLLRSFPPFCTSCFSVLGKGGGRGGGRGRRRGRIGQYNDSDLGWKGE